MPKISDYLAALFSNQLSHPNLILSLIINPCSISFKIMYPSLNLTLFLAFISQILASCWRFGVPSFNTESMSPTLFKILNQNKYDSNLLLSGVIFLGGGCAHQIDVRYILDYWWPDPILFCLNLSIRQHRASIRPIPGRLSPVDSQFGLNFMILVDHPWMGTTQRKWNEVLHLH